MSISDILDWLEALPLAAAVRGEFGWEWLFPSVEIVHVCALAIVFGSIAMVDLRLLGITSRDSSVSRLTAEMLPWTWTAFVIAAISGTIMFMSKAHIYWDNLQFRWKFVLMFLAFINMLVFQFGICRRVVEWDDQFPPPAAARIAGAFSVLLWIGVIFLGRWIGFTT